MLAFAAAFSIAICPAPPAHRVTCVHDGDTLWIEGEKIRIAEIDTPELNGGCPRERQLAIEARDRLVELLRNGGFTIERTGTDKYDRTLARLMIGGRSIGDQLVREGLAQHWPTKRSWCR